MDEHYSTLLERKYQAIGGLPWGGAWTLHIGFSHPKLFSALGTHSGVVFNTDVVDFYQRLNNFPEGMAPRVYIDVGDEDRQENIMYATWLDSMLTKNNIPHQWHLFKGAHNDNYWKAHVEEYLRWYCGEWVNDPALNNR